MGEQDAGGGGNEGGAGQVEVHDGEVEGEVLGAVEGGGKGGGDGGAGAVGDAGDAQAGHAQGDGVDGHGQQRDQGGQDGGAVGQQHGAAAAQGVEEGSGEDAAQAVAHGEHAHQGGGQGGAGPHGEGEILCKGDNGVAHGGQEDDAQEGTPEGEAAEHLAGGVVGGLKVLLYPVGGGLGLGQDGAGGGEADKKGGRDQHNSDGDAQAEEGRPPAHGGILDEGVGQGAEHEGGGAKAHQQRAGAGALFVGEPGLHGGEQHIIGKADAGGGDDAVAEVEHGQAAAVQPGGQYKADARQSAAQGDGQAGTQPPGQQTAAHSAQTEKAHGESKIHGQLGGVPAECVGQRCFQYGPTVKDTREEHGKDAYGQIKPPNCGGLGVAGHNMSHLKSCILYFALYIKF